MELWIRSQVRNKLAKIICVEYGKWNEEHRIYANGEVCGKYKTKERALEVLDEIQNIIQPKLICTGDYPSDITNQLKSDKCLGIFYDDTKMKFEQLNVYTYNMPKE